ncbi:MAG: hypothetical protein OXB86_06525, partial [Bdellovibrionales bacterium]|nr:hypothetical protein [Bdellovibrionales bacterium]
FRIISQELKESSLHFRFKIFGPEGPSWEARKELRKSLVTELETSYSSLKKTLPEDFFGKHCENLLTPGARPDCSFAAISVSHCPVLGGFIFSFNQKISLGLDMEQSHRVNEQLIGRLSKTEELQKAPDPSLLWAAKEAAFKCMTPEQNLLLKHILIFKWIKIKPDHYHFYFQVEGQDIKGRGAAFLVDTLALGFAILP